MKKFNKLFKVGTKVLLENGEWDTVTEIHYTRHWVKLKKFSGSFQRGHILKFSNKKA